MQFWLEERLQERLYKKILHLGFRSWNDWGPVIAEQTLSEQPRPPAQLSGLSGDQLDLLYRLAKSLEAGKPHVEQILCHIVAMAGE